MILKHLSIILVSITLFVGCAQHSPRDTDKVYFAKADSLLKLLT
jgi:hypothetical protein